MLYQRILITRKKYTGLYLITEIRSPPEIMKLWLVAYKRVGSHFKSELSRLIRIFLRLGLYIKKITS